MHLADPLVHTGREVKRAAKRGKNFSRQEKKQITGIIEYRRRLCVLSEAAINPGR